ncbi:MAG TPA: NrtA/SsuA/CpmA family ABC transporter substrate-binding protein [Desulfomonilaceae bacterium]|nr:NrtA/SsuA/CpmA family ABC transporter substrate-binding protein [Desulfomonilaceae bacterium]
MKIRTLMLLLSVVGLVALIGCEPPKSKTSPGGPMESLTLGTYAGDLSALIWIAEDQGYFAEHGLKIDVEFSESGLQAAKNLLEGKVDLATASEIVAARFFFERPDLRIITNLCESDNLKLVARKDHGITQLEDLKHKRIGVLCGSNAEFFLDLLMALHNIPSKEVQKVDLSPSRLVKAISKGDVDAGAVWEPFAMEATNNLGTNALSWPAQSGQSYYWLLLGTENTIKRRSRAVQAFVSSMISAEEFVKNHQDEAKGIVARKSGSSHHIEIVWKEIQFAVGLDHPLILTMETELRWMFPDLQTKQSDIPDILNFIYFDALRSVQPERIKILH